MKRAIIFSVIVMCFAVSAESAILTFTHEGSGSGMLDGVAFGSLDFVITATGETNDRESFGGGWFINHTSASISIDGLGEFDFLTGTRTFVNNDASLVGFSREGLGGADLFDGPSNAVFSTWDMLDPIGPISGSGGLMQWDYTPQMDTNAGILFFDGTSGAATFTATAVPEPGTMLMLGLGAFVLRRKR